MIECNCFGEESGFNVWMLKEEGTEHTGTKAKAVLQKLNMIMCELNLLEHCSKNRRLPLAQTGASRKPLASVTFHKAQVLL